MGGAPSPLVRRAFQLTSVDKEITKPIVMATRLHDRDFLAQLEAVDRFMASMHAYPGRTFGQLYHQFFRVNDLADGHMVLSDHEIDLASVEVPVLSIAGETDVLAPQPAVHHVGELLTGAPEVRLETAPGGHLGVLTGRAARRTTWPTLDGFLKDAAPGDDDADVDLAPGGLKPPLRARSIAPSTLTRTMTLRRLLLLPLVLLALPAPASAAEQVIAPGVKAGGVDVGGQTVESAASNLQLALGEQLGRPIDVTREQPDVHARSPPTRSSRSTR